MDDGPGRDGATLPVSRQCRTVWKRKDRRAQQRRVRHFKIITTTCYMVVYLLSFFYQRTDGHKKKIKIKRPSAANRLSGSRYTY